ncbi:hypothetical protein QTP70_024001 [Hemibagrus guttatus]|uniref:SEFIR domain-containing protein n=1 Tax=Hemibagrus guttatus TaxID=175788 RepID=A0AAE0QWE4_9TELE|nr:hypothetical protein QTP70_024001 [Hemibagrus guttatus]
MAHQGHHQNSLNCPEENDETRSEEFQSGLFLTPKTSLNHSIALSRVVEGQTFSHQHNPIRPSVTQSHVKLTKPDQLTGPCPQALYPNQFDTDRRNLKTRHGWHYPSYQSQRPRGCQTSSLPPYLPSTECQTYLGSGCVFPSWHASYPGTHSFSLNSLEQPGSLHSFLASGSSVHTNQVMPFPGLHCGYNGPVPLHIDPQDHLIPRPGYQPPHRHKVVLFLTDMSRTGRAAQSFPRNRSTSLAVFSLACKGKVFVTYEVDSEDHLKEVIKFVALLRNNGFDTHIDVFEQQLYSISKIDCMERYLNEDYLIIMVISLKYFGTVTGAGVGVDCDERTSNTVYIHKQLQSEFIQNGCRNFRVVPVLFPGAKKSYVPFWLQNTQVYSWPRDRDDILRRLMRVEKYNPPPVGPLPTIFSMPI